MADHKFVLSEKDLPTHWYNIMPDMVSTGGPPPPPLHPGTHQPIGPDDLAPLFPMSLIPQEVSQERFIEIPEPVRDIYKLWRPSPLYRAHRLEKALGTPAHIYYKYEGVSPGGSHKPNTAVAQAYYNKQAGMKRLTTETGAGQWGSALSLACNFFDMELKVYMVKVSYQQKPYRRIMMETWGGTVVPSPSTDTNSGRQVLAENPDTPVALASPSARPSKTPPPVRTRSTRSAACSTTSSCIRPSSAKKRSSRWRWPASIRTSSSAAPAAAPTLPVSPSPSCESA